MKRLYLKCSALIFKFGILFLLLPVGCGTPVGEPADLVLHHGKIVTLDDAVPQAQAIAVRGGKIVAVGSDAEMEPLIGESTEVIDLEGKLVVPGFIEGHGHFMGLGSAKMRLDLTRVRNWDEIVSMVAQAAGSTAEGEWILGRGWHQEKWDRAPDPSVEGLPTHASLSSVSPNHPVYLTHASGHASFANARALELAGINRNTGDPEGGEIVRDQRGNPTGVLRENAQDLVEEAIRQADESLSEEERENRLRWRFELAAQEALSKGVTSFQDAGASFQTIDFFKKMADQGAMPLRLYVMVRFESNEAMAEKLAQYRMVGYGGEYLTVRSIKRQVDGALGSHGAWLLEPYSDLPRSTGLVLETVEEIRATAELAVQHGYQVNTHAIGDRANREMLDLYAAVFSENPEKEDLRWRIEHAQHLAVEDIPRFAELGVIASMQAIHACSDAPWVPERLGMERARQGAYLWQELWKSGAVVTNGTDVPVEDINPMISFQCSVARQLPGGSLFFEGQPDQRMTREQALRSYTLNNAYAAFEENVKGSLQAGKLADLVVLSKDIMAIPVEEIDDTQVLYTIVGGTVRYRNE